MKDVIQDNVSNNCKHKDDLEAKEVKVPETRNTVGITNTR